MYDLRIFFSKTGRAKYISHLDLNRCFQRVFKRSGLPVWYTQGFNTHIYLTFSLPISLGFESQYESCDFRLTEERDFKNIMDQLNQALPDGIRVINVGIPKIKHTEISSADYKITLKGNNDLEIYCFLKRMLALEEIMVEKKSKKGIETFNFKDYLNHCEVVNDNGVSMMINLPAGTTKNINPSLLTDFLIQNSDGLIKCVSITRNTLLLSNGELFR